jgi:hypothetical protein
MLSLALNFVKEKDKNYILAYILKHSKLSQRKNSKNMLENLLETQNWGCVTKHFLFLPLANSSFINQVKILSNLT